MTSLSQVLHPDTPKRGAIAKERLTAAYRDVFDMKREDVMIVLTDMAERCGYFRAVAPPADLATLADSNARRAVFGGILHFLTLNDTQLLGLATAAREELNSIRREGDFS